jgi:enoyl-CoA hydratase/carnithine racemase
MNVTTEYSHDGRVATWWLDRPEARNAVNLEMWEALRDAASAADANPDVAVVIIRGRGEHFSAGADIGSLGRSLAADHDGTNYRATNLAAERAISSLRIPTIAAIEGFCVGGGVQIALACDIRIASSSSTFGVTPARLGISYPAVALQRLVAIAGYGLATELLLAGEMISAERAGRSGLIQQRSEDLDASVQSMVNALLQRSPFTQMATKQLLNAMIDAVDISELGRRMEQASLDSPDLDEGLTAFKEKRAPGFTFRR